jgi:hypothetical protein
MRYFADYDPAEAGHYREAIGKPVRPEQTVFDSEASGLRSAAPGSRRFTVRLKPDTTVMRYFADHGPAEAGHYRYE